MFFNSFSSIGFILENFADWERTSSKFASLSRNITLGGMCTSENMEMILKVEEVQRWEIKF